VTDYAIDAASPRLYQELELRLHVDRQADGTMTRFALPILMLLILAGLTFWAGFDTRVETTMTILLSVSALYVVIIGNIPQLGYLTTFDTWIFTMFVTLVVCVCGHQMVLVILRKGDTWPMRTAMTRVIEMMGRVILIPFTILIYWVTFVRDPTFVMNFVVYGTLSVATAALFTRELGGCRKAMRIATKLVKAKIDTGEDLRLSKMELTLFNFFALGTFNNTTKPYRSRKKRRARAKLEFEMREKNNSTGTGDSSSQQPDAVENVLHGKTTFCDVAVDELADSDDDSD
jgi:hypothetical protein